MGEEYGGCWDRLCLSNSKSYKSHGIAESILVRSES
jgi:hypothetical protein